MGRRFDHERLDVYRLTLKSVAWVTDLLEEVKQSAPVPTAAVRKHLDEAALSILFNTAEGNGKRRRPVRARFFDDARGSATECAAALDALVAKRACSAERVAEGKEMLVRAFEMLTRLVQRYARGESVRESEVPYGLSEDAGRDGLAWEDGEKIEDENDDEDEDDGEIEHEDDDEDEDDRVAGDG